MNKIDKTKEYDLTKKQKDVAKLMHVTPATISKWESPEGTLPKDYSDLKRLAEIYDVSLDELFGIRHFATPENLGYIIDRNNLKLVDGRLVYIKGENGFTGEAIVDYKSQKFIISKTEEIPFSELRKNFVCYLLDFRKFRES